MLSLADIEMYEYNNESARRYTFGFRLFYTILCYQYIVKNMDGKDGRLRAGSLLQFSEQTDKRISCATLLKHCRNETFPRDYHLRVYMDVLDCDMGYLLSGSPLPYYLDKRDSRYVPYPPGFPPLHSSVQKAKKYISKQP